MGHTSSRNRNFTKTILCFILFLGIFLFLYSYSFLKEKKNKIFDQTTITTAQNSKHVSSEIFDILQLDFMHQEDPSLWKHIREHHLVPPSTKEYNLINPEKDDGLATSSNPDGGQYVIAMKILKNMTNGFFVEAGAYDGERYSNTLNLERKFNWTGILIEADPLKYPYLKTKHRKAWLSDVCLSPSTKPQLVTFNHADAYDVASRVGKSTKMAKKWTAFEVQCFPIYAILSAIGVTVVDYFSLDVEGIEVKVLESIPFDKVLIKVFSIEFQLVPDGPESIKTFMESKGYRLFAQTRIDFIYAHSSLFEE